VSSFVPIALIAVVFAATYFTYFRYRSKMKKAGGASVYHRQLVEQRLGLAGTQEGVTAAWIAVTVPKNTASRAALEITSGVFAAMGGVGVQIVGRPLLLAFTTGDRLMYRDRSSGQQEALTRNDVRITDTGRKGAKWTEERTFGFVQGQVLRFDYADGRYVDVDVISYAVPTLLAWSNGASVAGLDGPFPPKGTFE
jgi:hypothetical protein